MTKKTEGIALLSMYGDDEMDDEEEEGEASGEIAGDATTVPGERQTSAGMPLEEGSVEGDGHEGSSAERKESLERGAGGHEGPSDKDFSLLRPPVSTDMAAEGADKEAGEIVAEDDADLGGSPVELEDELLSGFLPPPPVEPCSPALQAKFVRYLELKDRGLSLNDALRKSKGYRNPDFMQQAVEHEGIDEVGSCYNPEVFNPHGYDAGDYYDVLVHRQRKAAEQKEQEKRQKAQIEFQRGGVQMPPKPVVQIVAGQKAVRQVSSGAGLLPSAPSAHPAGTVSASARSEDSKNTKRSKWDKTEPSNTSSAVAAAAVAADAAAKANAAAAVAALQSQLKGHDGHKRLNR